MTAASDAYTALHSAMETTSPLCLDDDRFTMDETDPRHVIELCQLCPLQAACRAFAIAARPTGAIYAGRRWSGAKQEDNQPRKEPTCG
jgi:hypothetical protein